MAATHFSGPVVSTGGFTGDITGNITGNVTGNTTGTHTGAVAGTTVSASGVVSVAAGTAAAPEITFTGDTDTGIYRAAANSIGFATNGAAAGTVDVNGFNGVLGGTTPAAATVTTVTASSTADLQGSVFALDNFTNNLTAHAGGGQASALALTTVINRITTVTTTADSVKLPAPTKVGQLHILINSASNSMQVFGSGTDTINGVATATGVAHAGGITALYVATTTGSAAAWFRLLSA